MNWTLITAGVLTCSVVLGFAMSLKLSFLVLLWGFVALVLAYPVLHKIPNKNIAAGLFVGLAFFASFPFKKLMQLDEILPSIVVTLVYVGILYVAGLGWKRSWS